MKHRLFISAVLTALCSITVAYGQSSSPVASLPRTDVYHVHFNRAAAGKAAALGDFLKTPAADATASHAIVLRHQDGASWDYCAIQHDGEKVTVDAKGNPRGPSMKGLSEWHTDTLASGPSWAEFAKQMGLDEKGASKNAAALYIVSTYRAIPGKEDELEKFLSGPIAGAVDSSAGTVVLQHLEGDAWRYVLITHYKSWQDFANDETKSAAASAKGAGPWFQLRELISFHEDTLSYRVGP